MALPENSTPSVSHLATCNCFPPQHLRMRLCTLILYQHGYLAVASTLLLLCSCFADALLWLCRCLRRLCPTSETTFRCPLVGWSLGPHVQEMTFSWSSLHGEATWLNSQPCIFWANRHFCHFPPYHLQQDCTPPPTFTPTVATMAVSQICMHYPLSANNVSIRHSLTSQWRFRRAWPTRYRAQPRMRPS